MFKNQIVFIFFLGIISTCLFIQNCFAESETISFSEKVISLGAPPEGFDVIPESIHLSKDLRNVSYVIYSDNDHKVIVHNKELSPPYYAVQPGSPFFSPEKNRHVYIAYKSKSGEAVAVIDGKPDPTFDNVDNFYFSSDDKRYAYRATKNGLQCIVLDGKPGPWYTGIPIKDNMRFSRDSKHFAYVALKEDKCVVVLDGIELKHSFQFIDHVRFSYDSKRIAYKGRIEKTKFTETWCAVIDEKKGNEYEKIFDLIFSFDSKNIAYAAAKNKKMTLVVNGNESEYYDRCGLPVYSPDSSHLSYSYFKKKKSYMVLDGEVLDSYDNIFRSYFSPDSSRYAYIGANGENWYCTIDGKKSKSFKQIGAFKFSPDSSRYAYGGVTEDGSLMIVDEVLGNEFRSVGEAYFSPDSKHIVHRAKHKSNDKWITILDGKDYGNFYNAIGKYKFSEDSRHLTYNALVQLAKKSVMVVDGKEQCADHEFKIIGEPYFSPDSNHIAYHVRTGKNKWKLVVDGYLLEGVYGGFFKDSPIIFDSPNRFHTIALKEPGPEFLIVEVEIPEKIKIKSEM